MDIFRKLFSSASPTTKKSSYAPTRNESKPSGELVSSKGAKDCKGKVVPTDAITEAPCSSKDEWSERVDVITKEEHDEYVQFARDHVQEIICDIPKRSAVQARGIIPPTEAGKLTVDQNQDTDVSEYESADDISVTSPLTSPKRDRKYLPSSTSEEFFTVSSVAKSSDEAAVGNGQETAPPSSTATPHRTAAVTGLVDATSDEVFIVDVETNRTVTLVDQNGSFTEGSTGFGGWEGDFFGCGIPVSTPKHNLLDTSHLTDFVQEAGGEFKPRRSSLFKVDGSPLVALSPVPQLKRPLFIAEEDEDAELVAAPQVQETNVSSTPLAVKPDLNVTAVVENCNITAPVIETPESAPLNLTFDAPPDTCASKTFESPQSASSGDITHVVTTVEKTQDGAEPAPLNQTFEAKPAPLNQTFECQADPATPVEHSEFSLRVDDSCAFEGGQGFVSAQSFAVSRINSTDLEGTQYIDIDKSVVSVLHETLPAAVSSVAPVGEVANERLIEGPSNASVKESEAEVPTAVVESSSVAPAAVAEEQLSEFNTSVKEGKVEVSVVVESSTVAVSEVAEEPSNVSVKESAAEVPAAVIESSSVAPTAVAEEQFDAQSQAEASAVVESSAVAVSVAEEPSNVSIKESAAEVPTAVIESASTAVCEVAEVRDSAQSEQVESATVTEKAVEEREESSLPPAEEPVQLKDSVDLVPAVDLKEEKALDVSPSEPVQLKEKTETVYVNPDDIPLACPPVSEDLDDIPIPKKGYDLSFLDNLQDAENAVPDFQATSEVKPAKSAQTLKPRSVKPVNGETGEVKDEKSDSVPSEVPPDSKKAPPKRQIRPRFVRPKPVPKASEDVEILLPKSAQTEPAEPQTSNAVDDQPLPKPSAFLEEDTPLPKKGYDLSFLDKLDDLENASPASVGLVKGPKEAKAQVKVGEEDIVSAKSSVEEVVSEPQVQASVKQEVEFQDLTEKQKLDRIVAQQEESLAPSEEEILAQEAASVCEEIFNLSRHLDEEDMAEVGSPNRNTVSDSNVNPMPSPLKKAELDSRTFKKPSARAPPRKSVIPSEDKDDCFSDPFKPSTKLAEDPVAVNTDEMKKLQEATANEQFVSGSADLFTDPSALDFLSEKGGRKRTIAKNSLYTKFDPIVSEALRAAPDGTENPPNPRASLVLFSPTKEGPMVQSAAPVVPRETVNATEPPGDYISGQKHREIVRTLELTYEDRFLQKQREIQELQKELEQQRLKVFKAQETESQVQVIINEYESVITELTAKHETLRTESQHQIERLKEDLAMSIEDLRKTERAFNDTMQKYERTKSAMEVLQANEELLKNAVEQYNKQIELEKQKMKLMKESFTEKFEQALMNHKKELEASNLENTRLNALLKRASMQTKQLETQNELLKKNNEELTSICDGLVAQMSS